MSDVPGQDVDRLFLATRELPESQWESALQGCPSNLRQEVLDLLAHDRAPNPLLAEMDCLADMDREWTPDSIGQYAVVRRIGEGAMGVVFEAIEEGLGRHVAIKVLLPGRHSRTANRRFEQEARALALMTHPNIAKILRVGTAREGRFTFPFIVMELVNGRPLTEFMERSAPDRARRLRTMIKVAEAVEHAHQKGIIHRDLKPSNILVTDEGEPRVLDFGIARLFAGSDEDRSTMTGEVLGTPPYLSPEQQRGESSRIDTRSDIFSLGVLLKEVLAGRGREARSSGEDGEQPFGARPVRGLNQDEWAVVRKATAERSDDRYANVNEFAEELRRLARRQPVMARRYSVPRRVWSNIRRHKPLALAVTAVLVGGVLAAWQAGRANREVRTLQEVLLTFCAAPYDSGIDDADCRRLVQRIRELDMGGSLEEASVFSNIGTLMRNKGYRPTELAEECLTRALAIRRRHLGSDNAATLATQNQLASVKSFAGREIEAERESREVLAKIRGAGSEVERLRVQTIHTLVSSLNAQQRFQESIALLEPLVKSDSPFRTESILYYARALDSFGKDAEARKQFQYLERVLRESRADDDLLARVLVGYSTHILRVDGDLSRSMAMFRDAERYAGVYSLVSGVPDYMRLCKAGFDCIHGDPAASEAALRMLLEVDHLNPQLTAATMLECRNMLGVCLRNQGKHDEAEVILREVLAERRSNARGEPAAVANSMVNLAKLLVRRGEVCEAIELSEDAFRIRMELHGSDAAETIESMGLHGQLLVATGRQTEGFAILDRAMEARLNCPASWIADLAVDSYASALLYVGRSDQARTFLNDEFTRAAKELGEDHSVTKRRRAALEEFQRNYGRSLTSTPSS